MPLLTADFHDIQDVTVFQFYGHNRQLTKCQLLVHPLQGWAVATELPDTKNLVSSVSVLAGTICEQYRIDPTALALLTRHVNGHYYEAYYTVHFARAEHTGAGIVYFESPTRHLLSPEATANLLLRLQAGLAPDPTWRAIRAA